MFQIWMFLHPMKVCEEGQSRMGRLTRSWAGICAQPQPCVGSGWDYKTTTNHNSWSETKTKTTTMWCISLPECLAGYKNHNHIQLRWVVSPRNTKTTIMDLVRPGCRHPGSRHKTRKSFALYFHGGLSLKDPLTRDTTYQGKMWVTCLQVTWSSLSTTHLSVHHYLCMQRTI